MAVTVFSAAMVILVPINETIEKPQSSEQEAGHEDN